MSARDRYVHLAIMQLEKPVLWGAKGPWVFDCSGLCTWLLWQVGGPDLTHLDNAQVLYDHTRQLAPKTTDAPAPGDLVFYGYDPTRIIHVAIWLAGGHVLSADGATQRITTLEAARMAGARVRLHTTTHYRNEPFQVVHRNVPLDDVDLVTR